MIQKFDGTYFSYNEYTKIVRTKRRAVHLKFKMPFIKYHVYSVTLELVRRGYSYQESLAMVKNSKDYYLFQKEKRGWGKHKNRKYFTLKVWYHGMDAAEFADYILEELSDE